MAFPKGYIKCMIQVPPVERHRDDDSREVNVQFLNHPESGIIHVHMFDLVFKYRKLSLQPSWDKYKKSYSRQTGMAYLKVEALQVLSNHDLRVNTPTVSGITRLSVPRSSIIWNIDDVMKLLAESTVYRRPLRSGRAR